MLLDLEFQGAQRAPLATMGTAAKEAGPIASTSASPSVTHLLYTRSSTQAGAWVLALLALSFIAEDSLTCFFL